MIPHNKEAYEDFCNRVDTFAREQGIYPTFPNCKGGLRAEFNMEDEGYVYIFELKWDLDNPFIKWRILEGIK
jgi:hypothetical protein